jgi:taurine dioxygenase
MNTLIRNDLRIERYTGRVGALITGVDLATEDRPEVFAAIARALHETGVIFLPGQAITAAQYAAFGRRFGPFDQEALDSFPAVPEDPLVKRLIRQPDDVRVVGEWWHVDQVWREDHTRYTSLMAIELPPFGGDTCFMNAAAAFEALSEGVKATLRPLRAIQSLGAGVTQPDARQLYQATAEMKAAFAVRPVVTRHPDTGREILFVNPAFTERFEGWTVEESRPLLNQLYAHCTARPDFQCRFKWTPGAIAVWDNRQVWHYALNDTQGHRREMLRLMIG